MWYVQNLAKGRHRLNTPQFFEHKGYYTLIVLVWDICISAPNSSGGYVRWGHI